MASPGPPPLKGPVVRRALSGHFLCVSTDPGEVLPASWKGTLGWSGPACLMLSQPLLEHFCPWQAHGLLQTCIPVWTTGGALRRADNMVR